MFEQELSKQEERKREGNLLLRAKRINLFLLIWLTQPTQRILLTHNS